MVKFWLSFVLVLVLVPSPIGRCSCSIVVAPHYSTSRCSIHDQVEFSYREDDERESRTTEPKDGSASRVGNRHTARLDSRSITSKSTAALSTSTMGYDGVSARTTGMTEGEARASRCQRVDRALRVHPMVPCPVRYRQGILEPPSGPAHHESASN